MKPPPAYTGRRGKYGRKRGARGKGGTVTLYCGNWTSLTSLTFDVVGGKGGKGGHGGDGGDGKIGSRSLDDSCGKLGFNCFVRKGKRGQSSRDGGRGGNRGSGGNAVVVSKRLLGKRVLFREVEGGSGGSPGTGGKAGPNFPP